MTMRQIGLVISGLAVVAVVVWVLHDRTAQSSTPVPVPEAQSPAPRAPASAPAPAIAVAPAAPVEAAVAVKADAVVARVNGTAITGKDLVAFRAGIGNLSMSHAMYESLLQRAIDRELTVQKARKDGVALDDVHKHQLDMVREAQGQRTPNDPAQVEWEVKDAEGRMLLEALLVRDGVSSIPDQKDVDKYYQDHRGEFGDMPRANADLEIRQTLSTDMAAKFTDSERDFQQRLRAAAQITR